MLRRLGLVFCLCKQINNQHSTNNDKLSAVIGTGVDIETDVDMDLDLDPRFG